MGLFAKEPLYSIEKNRLNRNRERARGKQKAQNNVALFHFRDSFLSLIKKILPNHVLDKLEKLLMSLSNKAPVVDKAFINEHGHRDFFYRTDNLSTALDLWAICTDDERAMQDIRNKLSLL